MGNEVINESKDCCKTENSNSNNCCFLDIVDSTTKGISRAVKSAEELGSGLITGAANGIGIPVPKETADAISRAAIKVAAGGAVGLAAEAVVQKPGLVAAGVAVGAGAAAAELLKDSKASKCASDCAKDAAIGAAIGAGIGVATGDATRAATLAALGAVTGCAARCAADCCKPACCVTGDAVSVAKDLGKAVLDHVKNRPLEAAAEAAVAGVPGVVGGAMVRKFLEQKDNCEKLCEKAMKNACAEIKRQAEAFKKMFDPKHGPVIEMGPMPIPVKDIATPLPPLAVELGTEAAKQAAQFAKQSQSELEQHRKDNPTSSKVEKAIGYAAGGPIAGKAVGTAIEYGDVKARQAYRYIKSWFE